MSGPQAPRDPELNAVESALGSLTPAPVRLDRDRVMFRAGQVRATVRTTATQRWAWPAIAASLAAVALGEGIMLNNRPDPTSRVVERLVVVREPAPESPPTPEPPPETPTTAPVVILSQRPEPEHATWSLWPSSSRYDVALRRQVLRFGVEGLPEPPPLVMQSTDERPASSGRMLQNEIESLLNPGEPS